MTPLISIISANFNKGKLVRETLESVQNQTFENWEYIFIDDGSTDDSLHYAKTQAAGDARCVFTTNTSGLKGANAARNLGLKMAKGTYILILDSDDLMSTTCLEERLIEYEKHPNLDFIVYPMQLFNDTIGDCELISNIPTQEPDLHRFLNRDIVWSIAGPIWKKTALEKLGGFDLNLHSQQDVDLHIRALIQDLKYLYIHKIPDVYYRRNVESEMRKSSQSVEHFRQRFQMILHHRNLLEAAAKLGETERMLLARYVLDIAQMMRWHIGSLGKRAQSEALDMWKQAYDLKLVEKENFNIGISYLRFKHNMLFNRIGFLQRYLDKNFKNQLGNLIASKPSIHGNVTVKDYAV